MRRTNPGWAAGLVILVLASSACGVDLGGEEPAAGPGTSGVGTGAPVATVRCGRGETDGDLVLSNWANYIDPALLGAFEDDHGVAVTLEEHRSNEELLDALRDGSAEHDVVVPSDYMVRTMRAQGLLLELDPEAIPNRRNVADGFADPPYDPGNRFSLPYQWGTTGLGVDTAVVGDDPPASWSLVFDPGAAGGDPGRIALLDDPREAMAAALAYLGHPANTTQEDELRDAADLLADARERGVAFVSDGYTDLLLSGELAVAHGFSSDHVAAAAGAADPDRYRYLVPVEGATKWVDAMAIPADAPHPCSAHTFIDFLLDGERGAQLTNWNYYASPNAAAEEHVLPAILEDERIYPPPGTRLHFLEDVGEAGATYRELFAGAKADGASDPPS